jgi:hypothetical protein
VRNPLRDEGAAFQVVLLALVVLGLIALGSWINTWFGLAVFVAEIAAGAWWLRRALHKP